jgi:hypothetical protein
MTKKRAPDSNVEGVSPEVARTLLELNPSLRAEGIDTQWMVGQLSAREQAGEVVTDLGAAVAEAIARLQRVERGIEAELRQRRAAAREQTARELYAWLLAHDPEIAREETQRALRDNKTLLDGVGFSVKAYRERHKQR